MAKQKKSSGKDGKSSTLTERAELLAGAVFACLYAATVLYLLALALFSDPDPVRFEIAVSEQRRVGGAVHVEFEVLNLGNRSIAQVHVGTTGARDFAKEVVFDYIPAGSMRRGTIIYSADAAPPDPAISVISYRDP